MGKNGYELYLGKLLLPVAPKKLEVTVNNANETVTLIGEGEASILKAPGLTDIEFECMIPQSRYPFASYGGGFEGAKHFLDYFEKLKTKKKPFQFVVSRATPQGGPLFSTSIKVSMEDYRITEQAADGLDLTVEVRLKQYRDYGTKTVKIKKPKSGAGAAKATVKKHRPTEDRPEPKNYKAGDVVNFHGGTHYYSSYEGAKGYAARAGKARITLGPDCEGNGGAHPWHLVHADGASNVYGWVDEGTFD